MALAAPVYEYTRPPLTVYQLEHIFCPERFAILEAGSKSGKTFGCLVWLTEHAMQGRPGWNYWWVAPTYAVAGDAYDRLAHKFPRGLVRTNDTEQSITFRDAGTMTFLGADVPDNLYGRDVHAAVLDEISRMREAAYIAVMSTLTATGGPMRLIGNVKGRHTWAYRLARKAEAGNMPDWHYGRFTALDAIEAGILTREAVLAAQDSMPEHEFLQLYYAEAADDGTNPFGQEAILRCIAGTEPAPGPPVVFGVDLGSAQDWTVIIGLNDKRQVCHFDRMRLPWNETRRRLEQLARFGVPVAVDNTGLGAPIVASLQYSHPDIFTGITWTAQRKMRMLTLLAETIQQGGITFPDGPLVAELQAFEFQYTATGTRYGAPPGMTDDCVAALAMATCAWSYLTMASAPRISIEYW